MDPHTFFFTRSFFPRLCVKFGYLNEIWITEGFTEPQSHNMTCLGRVLHIQGGRQKNSMWISCLPMCCALGDTYGEVIEFYLLNSAWIFLCNSLKKVFILKSYLPSIFLVSFLKLNEGFDSSSTAGRSLSEVRNSGILAPWSVGADTTRCFYVFTQLFSPRTNYSRKWPRTINYCLG